MDFRRADPQYVNFVPKTVEDAIDLFNRHRNLGLTADLYPECFVHCARALPDAELDKFHRFIVQPTGDLTKGGEKPSLVDAELEKERQLLLKEAELRDGLATMTIEEEKTEPMEEDEKSPTEPMEVDEKSPTETKERPTETKERPTETKECPTETKPTIVDDLQDYMFIASDR